MTASPHHSDAGRLRRQQRAVVELGLIALQERSLDDLLNHAVRIVRDGVGVEMVKVIEAKPDGGLLVRAGVGWPEGIVGVLEISAADDSQASYALRTRAPVVTEDLLKETRFIAAPVFLELRVRSGVNVVIQGSGAPYGVLEADSRQARTYSFDDIDFLQAAANILSHAITRQQYDLDRERLLNLASHELRNPLTVVLAFARRLHRQFNAEPSTDPMVIDQLESLLHSAERLQDLVLMLFQLGELERWPPEFTPQPVAVVPLLRELVQRTREMYPDISLEERYQVSPIIISNDLWVRSVLGNIIENAAKYSVVAPRVTIELNEAHGQLALLVTDGCGGIAGDELDHLFDPYFRGQAADRARGLGLGLYIAGRLATALGWIIRVQNMPPVGCQFQILINSEPAGDPGDGV